MSYGPITNKQGFSSALQMRNPFPVLDGELAVPCNPESAIPGSNAHPRFFVFRWGIGCVTLKIRSCATRAHQTPPGPEGSNGR